MANRMINRGEAVGLPPRMFLYTLDQVASLLDITLPEFKKRYVWFDGRTVGKVSPNYMLARNIADDDVAPDWRIAEHELVRWAKRKGFRFYERGWITS